MSYRFSTFQRKFEEPVFKRCRAATVDASMLGPAEQFIALLVFSAIASLTIAAPVAANFLARHRSEAIFAICKDWLIRNNAIMLIILLLVFGTLLIVQGIKLLGVVR